MFEPSATAEAEVKKFSTLSEKYEECAQIFKLLDHKQVYENDFIFLDELVSEVDNRLLLIKSFRILNQEKFIERGLMLCDDSGVALKHTFRGASLGPGFPEKVSIGNDQMIKTEGLKMTVAYRVLKK